MASVTVTIDGRSYRVGCEEGQQDRLTHLAQELERRIAGLRTDFGEIGDNRLIVMAALMMGDEIADASRRIRRLEEELSGLQDARVMSADRSQATQAAVITALNAAAERIERVTKSLNQSLGDGIAIG